MKTEKIGYWAATGLVAFAFAFGGVMDIARPPEVMAGIKALGYPEYFALIIGVWKVLGAAAVLAPRLPRLKEWAYAGMVFDLTGAAASHAAVGDPAAKVVVPLVLLALVVASYVLRPAGRALKLADGAEALPAARVPAHAS